MGDFWRQAFESTKEDVITLRCAIATYFDQDDLDTAEKALREALRQTDEYGYVQDGGEDD